MTELWHYPTPEQYKLIAQQKDKHGRNLRPDLWLVMKETESELHITNRIHGRKRIIKKAAGNNVTQPKK
jgi:hypothetical protein